MLKILSFLFLFALPQITFSQSTEDPTPAGNSGLEEIKDHVAAIYEIVSGPAGERDWDRLRKICHPDARFCSMRPSEQGGKVPNVNSTEKFIEGSSRFAQENAFYEKEVSQKIDHYGTIAHVFSNYEAEFGGMVVRGTNSIQFIQQNGQWLILSVTWDSAKPEKKKE